MSLEVAHGLVRGTLGQRSAGWKTQGPVAASVLAIHYDCSCEDFGPLVD